MRDPAPSGYKAGYGIYWFLERVPESNSGTRICNPENFADLIGKKCKRTCFVHGHFSIGYEREVNGFSQAKRQRKTAEGAATHLNGPEEFFLPHDYANFGLTSSQLAVRL
ncbi:hypothetical protein [Pseudorhodobacter turbinis]|nr:hypothetical protein [Pseudorhodobacter turbinis]